MYQGNEQKYSRRKVKKTKKSVALLASFLLLLCVTIGGTAAFLVDTSETVTNKFTPSKVTTEVVETRSGNVKSNVKIKNTGDTEAYIRAAVIVTWQDENGNVYGQKPVACTTSGCDHENCDKDYAIAYNLTNETESWKKSSDGLYYWTSPVLSQEEDSQNCFTENLIQECKALKTKTVGVGDDAVTYYLNVEIIGSGIQSKPKSVVTSEWSSGVGGFVDEDSTILSIKTN